MKPLSQVIVIGCLCSLLYGCAVALAEPIHEQMVCAVVGEALHDQESMLYMAHALINRFRIRGDLRGVYGVNPGRGKMTPKLRNGAEKALFIAHSGPDVTHGATHWLSDYDLTHCKPSRMSWRFSMVETAYQGQTHYYREK